MKPNIEFVECLRDSPRFRASLEEAETDIDQLEARLERLVKLCNNMIEAGKAFNNANSLFVSGIHDVARHFQDEETISASLSRFTHVLSELQKYNTILLDQAHRSICKNLTNFIKNDIKLVKETRKHFEKISDDMDNALMKNSQAPRSKLQECEECNNLLKATRVCFGHTSLDYVYQINVLHSKKRFDILDTLLSYMHAQSTYFHQGFDLFEDLEPYTKRIASQIEDLSSKANMQRKTMEERNDLVRQQGEFLQSSLCQSVKVDVGSGAQPDTRMVGYLFKRTTNAFKTWVRRWFVIDNNQLLYRKRAKDSVTIMEEDLRFCTVKPNFDVDRRFCFEVVSPSRSHMLQADTDQDCQTWVNAIQEAVSKAYSRTSSMAEYEREQASQRPTCGTQHTASAAPPAREAGAQAKPSAHAEASQGTSSSQPMKALNRMGQLLAIPGNDRCCDCGSPDPRWSSINLGITLCIECSGIHRSFGVHLSKVRSVTLDAWEPELIKVMAELGNNLVNRMYEAHVDETIARRATPQCPREIREKWIQAKYVKKSFIRRLPQPEDSVVTSSKDGDAPASPMKRWGVRVKRRRSPAKQLRPSALAGATAAESEAEAIPGEGAIKQVPSQDSGLGGSTDVIVFGADVNSEQEANQRALDLDSDSASETEADQDARSTTSYEDFSKLQPDLLLYKAAHARNLPVMQEALALGADPNWHCPEDEGKTPLVKAVEIGSMATVEFLLLNRAKVDVKDNRGQSPLHHATVHGHTGQVCQLLKRNANQHAIDEDGRDPLTIAVSNANADIVTLLRLAKLNEEMRETEGIYAGQGDETFNEVFRDFTNMANHSPEKLNRNK